MPSTEATRSASVVCAPETPPSEGPAHPALSSPMSSSRSAVLIVFLSSFSRARIWRRPELPSAPDVAMALPCGIWIQKNASRRISLAIDLPPSS